MRPTNVRDQFAELYVAGLFADKRWTVYFPRQDMGFDFIVTKLVKGSILIRPVQVKGVYPESIKTDQETFGRTVELTAIHPHMVFAMPYFEYSEDKKASPQHVGYFPLWRLSNPKGRTYRIQPAGLTAGVISIRKSYKPFFGDAGLDAVDSVEWSNKP